jgi:hypothetical protein
VRYVWCHNILYLVKISMQTPIIQYFAFDLDTQQLRQVKYSLFNANKFLDMNLDKEDGNILILCTKDDDDDNKIITQRFAFR